MNVDIRRPDVDRVNTIVPGDDMLVPGDELLCEVVARHGLVVVIVVSTCEWQLCSCWCPVFQLVKVVQWQKNRLLFR